MLKRDAEYTYNLPINITMRNIEEIPIHFHENDLEVLVVVEGEIKLIDGYRTMLLKKGDVFIVNELELHSIYSSAPNKILMIHFNLNYYSKLSPDFSDMFLMCETYYNGKMNYDLNIELKRKLRDITKVFITKGVNAPEEIINMSHDIMSFMNDSFQYFSVYEGRFFINKLELRENPANVKRIRKVVRYLYHDDCPKKTLQDLAEKEYVSMYYLSHLIKEVTGITFQELLNFTRVELSERYLLETNMRLSEIAITCGFSATRYFVKYFEKWYKMSPEVYRASRINHVITEEKQEYFDPDTILKTIENENLNELVANNPLIANFFSNVITFDASIMKPIKKLVSDNILVVNDRDAYRDMVSLKSMRTFNKKLKIAALISLSRFSDIEDDLNRVISFAEDNNIRTLVYELNDNLNLKNHISAFGQIKAALEDHMLQDENWIIYLDDGNSLSYFDTFSKKVSTCDVPAKILSCGNKVYGTNNEDYNYMYDTICAVPYLLNALINSKRTSHYKLIDNKTCSSKTLSGQSGFITWNGLKKASYFGYLFHSMLGREILSQDTDYIITRKDDDLQILVYDYDNEFYGKMTTFNNKDDIDNVIYTQAERKEYVLEICNLRGKYRLTKVKISEDCCLYYKLGKTDSMENFSRTERILLENSIFPEVTFETIMIKENFDIHSRLSRFGAELILLEKI